MDKIYSRKRIKCTWNKKNKKEYMKIFQITVIVLIAITVFIISIKSIKPFFRRICIHKAREISTVISNEESTAVMKNYKYEDIMKIHENSEGRIQMINANMITINEIISNVAIKIQDRMSKLSSSEIKIPMGNFSKNEFLFGRGPKIPMKIHILGSVKTDVRSEFIEAGINQTIHRVYLDVICDVEIVNPLETVEERITNQVILMENLIVGDIPDTYYNINGLDEQDYVEFVE